MRGLTARSHYSIKSKWRWGFFAGWYFMFDSVRMTFKVVFFPCLRTGIAAPLRDTVFVPVVFLLVFVFLLSKRPRSGRGPRENYRRSWHIVAKIFPGNRHPISRPFDNKNQLDQISCDHRSQAAWRRLKVQYCAGAKHHRKQRQCQARQDHHKAQLGRLVWRWFRGICCL